jgi:hypothetical protein
MQLFPVETSLVVAGAWNPAILTPAWVLRHGLNRPAGQAEPVQVYVPAGTGLIFDFPRYVLPEFTFVVRPDTLIMAPTDQTANNLEVLENAAALMLEHLRHTPINGIGHNFEYRDTEPSPDQLENFTRSRQDISDIMPGGKHRFEHRSESTARRRDNLKNLGGCRLLLACFSQFDGTAAKLSPQIGSRRTPRVPSFRLSLALRLGSLSAQFACTTPFRETLRHIQPLISGVGILSA